MVPMQRQPMMCAIDAVFFFFCSTYFYVEHSMLRVVKFPNLPSTQK